MDYRDHRPDLRLSAFPLTLRVSPEHPFDASGMHVRNASIAYIGSNLAEVLLEKSAN